MSEERPRLRFVSEEPKLAYALRKLDFKLLPVNVREWALGWVEDVGRAMRSREMMVGVLASAAYYVLLMGLLSVFPVFKTALERGTVLGRFLEGLGLRR